MSNLVISLKSLPPLPLFFVCFGSSAHPSHTIHLILSYSSPPFSQLFTPPFTLYPPFFTQSSLNPFYLTFHTLFSSSFYPILFTPALSPLLFLPHLFHTTLSTPSCSHPPLHPTLFKLPNLPHSFQTTLFTPSCLPHLFTRPFLPYPFHLTPFIPPLLPSPFFTPPFSPYPLHPAPFTLPF